MSDAGWRRTFNEGVDCLGCLFFNAVPKGTLHLDLSFTRDGVPHTVRVNIHFRD